MTDDDRFEAWLRDAAKEYHAPPPAPRDEIWAAIEARRHRQTVAPTRRTRVQWLGWAAGIAAVLAVGVALGRWSNSTGPAGTTTAPVAQAPDSGPGPAYRVAATEYLSRTEVFLTDFRQEEAAGRVDSAAGQRARALLADNRLLLDSPAAKDARLKALLEELELVLAEISQLPETPQPGERDMITNGLDDGDLMLRLRTAVPAGLTIAGT